MKILHRSLVQQTAYADRTRLTTGGNEGLEMLDVILLLLILLLLDNLVLSDRLDICVIVTRVVCQLLLCEPDDVGAHPIQEVLQQR